MLNSIFKINKSKFVATKIMAASILMLDTHVANAAEGTSSGGLPQLDITSFSSQIFWLAIAFILLYFIFAKKTLPEISEVIERRRETVTSDLETAEKLRDEAESVQKEYEASILDAKKEANELLADVQEDLSANLNKQAEEFKKYSAAQIDTTEQKALAQKNKILAELDKKIPEITSLIVQKVSEVEVSDKQIKDTLSSVKQTGRKAA
jgi:F-type H+-transporting ATPase subunit b